MDDNWVQNSVILSLLLLIIGVIINYVIGLLLDLFRLEISLVNDLGFLFIAYMIGLVYAKKMGQIMPKQLRFKTIGLFFMFYLITTFLISYFITRGEFVELLFATGFSGIVILFECLIIYWVLGFSGKDFVKNI